MTNEKKTKATKQVAKQVTNQTEKPSSPDAPGFGWTRYSEQVNGRFAMIGFVALLVLEALTNQDIFTWLGLR
ncbi:MAG: high light inducible protein [Alkalinema sp. FL-bin-369]|nr:high light inducible protein [Leptolyngbyaceae cyanobacterium LF-bin-369]